MPSVETLTNSRRNQFIRASLLASAFAGAQQLHAHSPELKYVAPVAIQSGTKATLHFHGDRLDKAKELLFYKPGITVEGSPTIHSPKHVSFQVHLSPESSPGMHPVRLRCEDGITYQKTFHVSTYPIHQETKENNDSRDKAQLISPNTCIHGITTNEDVDYYQLPLKRGQVLSAEIAGMRLGRKFFDPHLSVLDPDGREIATSDDNPLTKQDPFISIRAPKDGTYYLAVRESSYEGSDSSHYLLTAGHFPRPAAIYPPGAISGQESSFQFINTDGSRLEKTLKPTAPALIHASENQLISPSGIPLKLSHYPFTNEQEPNNGSKESLPAQEIPHAFHGIISKTNDVDWFQFSAKKDQDISIQVLARELGSPLDARIILRDSAGKQLAANDDSNNRPDSSLNFKIPKDGTYFINIRDHLANAGPNFTYRIEVSPRKQTLKASINRSDRNDSQLRKVINIPRGSSLAYQLNVARDRHSAAVFTTAHNLPEGVKLTSLTAENGVNNIPLYFEATDTAPLSGGLYPVYVESKNPNLKQSITEDIEHIAINNQGVYCSYESDKLAIAVTEAAPFDISLATPAIPAVQNGTIDLTITATREDGFDKEITLFFPWLPPGITAPGNVKIPKGKNQAVYHLSIKGDAPVKNWQLCVSALSDTDRGKVLLSSNLVPLNVKTPYLTAKLEIAATNQGTPVSLPCKIEQLANFSGNATLTLHGLPDGFKAQPVTLNSSTTEVLIPVELAKNARIGNHSNLFCHIEVPENGHNISHNTGHGGSLRVNAPPKDKPTAKKESKKPSSKPKPLSRLEQLRQELK
ncbi:hypothetical protein Rhal01_00747 [Rubritalea halochordaticola]|uniref:Peptidase C-terminal archaeal/bacterial domain-containing protein n=1 Tax=Rubritalea halochordaticola TaxID=714537 RepID=A0ABP9UXY9_9BACT